MTRQAVSKHLAAAQRRGARRGRAQRTRDALPADRGRRGVGRAARRAPAPPGGGAASVGRWRSTTSSATCRSRSRSVGFEIAAVEVSPEFTRKTTIDRAARRRASTGRGEDVTYDAAEHEPGPLPAARARRHLDARLALEAPRRRSTSSRPASRGRPPTATTAAGRSSRRRSTSRSSRPAARSATPSGARRGRSGSSPRPGPRRLDGWLALYPDLRFKLDPTPDWTDELVATLAARGNVDVVDLKGAYHGTVVDNPPNPELYRRVAEGFPGGAGSRIRR